MMGLRRGSPDYNGSALAGWIKRCVHRIPTEQLPWQKSDGTMQAPSLTFIEGLITQSWEAFGRG